MEYEKIIKTLRIHYFAMLAIVSAITLFLEVRFGEKPETILPEAMYIIQVFVVLFTLIFISVAIKGFTWRLEKAKGLSEKLFLPRFVKSSVLRTNLLFIVIAVNAMAYCMIGYEGALYCGLLGLGAMIYSYPTKRVLEIYLSNREK